MKLPRSGISVRAWLWRTALVFAMCVVAHTVHADESQHELLFFASVDVFDTFDVGNPEVEDTFARPVLDILYSYSGGRFRVLGEYLWSSHEAELERLKFGWELREDTMLWFGRMHTTSKFWTSEYHHGQFTQPTITRPSLEEWEDESGPLPSHVTGLSLEHSITRADESAVHMGFSIGFAPRFVDDELQAHDMLDPESGHGGSISAKVGYRPNLFSSNQFGFLASWNDINVDRESNPVLSDLIDINQLAYGIYGDWTWEKWRLLGSIVRFENDLRYTATETNDKFTSGYVQVEYQTAKDWTVFGRTDNGFGEDNSTYLRLLPAFVAHRHMLGARWDYADFQSLTLEAADTSQQSADQGHDTFKEIRLQWSAVFP